MNKSFQLQAVLFILFITVINYLDRSAISYAILPVENEFGLNNRDFGFIAAAFGIGYLPFCFFGGLLVDRFGPIKMWSLAAAVWSLSMIAMGFSQGFWSLFWLRVILGIAEAIHFPALLKAVTDWLHPNWHSRCIAFTLFGVPLASLIGAPFLSFLIDSYNWRIMFFILGLVGLFWSFLWTFCFWKKPIYCTRHETKMKQDIPIRKFFSSRIFIGNCLNFFIFGYVVFFALMWLPGYLEKTFYITILKTGFLVMVPWGAAALLLLCGGWLSDHLWKKRQSIRIARLYPIGMGLFLTAVCSFAMVFSNNLALDVFLLSLGLGFAFFTNAPLYSLNADLFKNRSGTAQGIMSCFFAFAGIVSPGITGWLVESTGKFKAAIFLVSILCLIGAFIAFLLERTSPNEKKLS